MNCSDFMTSKSNSRIKRKIIESLALREREKKRLFTSFQYEVSDFIKLILTKDLFHDKSNSVGVLNREIKQWSY